MLFSFSFLPVPFENPISYPAPYLWVSSLTCNSCLKYHCLTFSVQFEQFVGGSGVHTLALGSFLGQCRNDLTSKILYLPENQGTVETT